MDTYNAYSVSTQLKRRTMASEKRTSQKITAPPRPLVASSPRIFYTIAGESKTLRISYPAVPDSTHDPSALMHLLPHQDLSSINEQRKINRR
jgi:hypothetical protein